jgi:hypothetical protein
LSQTPKSVTVSLSASNQPSSQIAIRWISIFIVNIRLVIVNGFFNFGYATIQKFVCLLFFAPSSKQSIDLILLIFPRSIFALNVTISLIHLIFIQPKGIPAPSGSRSARCCGSGFWGGGFGFVFGGSFSFACNSFRFTRHPFRFSSRSNFFLSAILRLSIPLPLSLLEVPEAL